MLRIHLLQNLYDLSDEGTRNEIIDSRAFSDFCEVESSNQIPDGDTIGRFRNLLIKNHIQFFTAANEHDVNMTSKLFHGEEEAVNGDSGFIGAEKREDAILKNKNGKKIKYNINRRPFLQCLGQR